MRHTTTRETLASLLNKWALQGGHVKIDLLWDKKAHVVVCRAEIGHYAFSGSIDQVLFDIDHYLDPVYKEEKNESNKA